MSKRVTRKEQNPPLQSSPHPDFTWWLMAFVKGFLAAEEGLTGEDILKRATETYNKATK